MTIRLVTTVIDFLSGATLNYAVAKAQGHETSEDGLSMWVKVPGGNGESYLHLIPDYSTKVPWAWSVLESLKIEYRMHENGVEASFLDGERWLGQNYFEAGLRCFVASKFPNGIIEVPSTL